MARYIGPKTKIARRFREPIFGPDKYLDKKNYPPGQHGNSRRRGKVSEYGIQLLEKQKAKYTYGVLERQFKKTFVEAQKLHGRAGDNLLKLLEARLDNVVYRIGMAPTRAAARQLVSHKHIVVNGNLVNIPSYRVKAGDKISVRERSKSLEVIVDSLSGHNSTKFPWIEWDNDTMTATYLNYPERELIPENINEQLIVELYSK
ncbi:MAG: 30S ribosomal protein S4 [Bacteroidales bacterium]|nr:30S ribosomal protein S4 [Bacteroidales bacterium]